VTREQLLIQFENLSHFECKKRILNRLTEKANEIANDEFFDDIAKIGALLSSEIMCMAYIRRLNDSLLEYAKSKGVLKKMVTRQNQQALKPSPGFGQKQIFKTGIGDNDLDVSVEKHKQYKVLSGFLSEFETSYKFNEGSYNFTSEDRYKNPVLLNTTPGKAVTLPGFANADVFRQNLLARARHFKDPTVTAIHGEFTHRIQWYIVCEYARLTKQLAHEPAEVFKACARPVFVMKKDGGYTVWDMICEGAPDAKDFRKPEKVTEFFLRASESNHPQHTNLWFLCALMEGRYAKREIEKS
jgi:hypothetical protein